MSSSGTSSISPGQRSWSRHLYRAARSTRSPVWPRDPTLPSARGLMTICCCKAHLTTSNTINFTLPPFPRTDYVTWNGPNPALRKGPSSSLAKGPSSSLAKGPAGLAKGPNAGNARGPQGLAKGPACLARGSMYGDGASTRAN